MTLKEYMKKKKLRGVAFARLANTSTSNVSKWLHGHIKPTERHYKSIYKITGGKVTPNDLYDFKS